jgi:glycosyltransferase involved in cell wall biosynthesis
MKLSVVINTYNQAAFVVEAIESVLMQRTPFDFEIVIVDDCSTDGTREILISYADKYPGKVRLILYETNQALTDEMLLRHATADYVALLEGDDYWTDPEKLEIQVAFLDANPDYVLCGHNFVVRNEYINTEVVRPDFNQDLAVTLTTRELIEFYIPTASMVFRNRMLDTWPECFMRLGFGDRPLQIMLSKLGKVRYFTRPMSVYRIHSGGAWSSRYRLNLEKPIPDTTPEGRMKLIEYWEALSVYLDHQYDEDIFELIANMRNNIDRSSQHPHRMKIQSRWKVFTVIYRPTPLLLHFVRHYAALGFTDIVIAASTFCAGIDWDAIRTAAGDAEVHVEPLYPGVFDTARDTAILNSMKARYIEDCDEWSAQTNLDEFYEFPLPLGELAAAAGAANCVQGLLVDRVAADGSLPPIRDDVPIAEQFPVETRITKCILGGNVRKLMLTRGFQNIAQGHQRMNDEHLFRPDGRVLHYKWTSTVLDHLAERIATREQTGDKWTQESERFLDYWQRNGRIVFAHCL